MDSSRSPCALASTSRRRIFSAPATASAATWSRSCSRARDTSCSISALAAAFSRLPSSLAAARASSTSCAPRSSACARISVARLRASLMATSACRVDCSSVRRPWSAAASPSAMVFCRVSMARDMYGQTNLAVNQMKLANTSAWATSVKLRFMLPSAERSAECGGERIGEGEEHRDPQTDDERSVDQAEQQEHLTLQRIGELGLARRGFEEAAAHDADADARPGGAQSDHQADADARIGLHHRQQLKFFHCGFFLSKTISNELMVLVRHRDIDDGEHHEDVSLQQHDEDVKNRPAQSQDRAEYRAREPGRRPHPQQQEQDLACVHVAEQPQRVRQRLGNVLDAVEQKIC